MAKQTFIAVKLKRIKNHFKKGGTVNDDLTAIINIKSPHILQGYVEKAREELESEGVKLKKKQFKEKNSEEASPEDTGVVEEEIGKSDKQESDDDGDPDPDPDEEPKKGKKKGKKDKKNKKGKPVEQEEPPAPGTEQGEPPVENLLLKADGSAVPLVLKKSKGQTNVWVEASDVVASINIKGQLVNVNAMEVMTTTKDTVTIGEKSYPTAAVRAAVSLAS